MTSASRWRSLARSSLISYIGVPFRTRSVEEVREIMRKMRADLWDAVTAGSLRNPIVLTRLTI